MNESNCQYDVTWDMKSDKDEDTRATEGGTVRADGTRRKERKIRPGYNPPGSVQVYVPRHRRARGEDGTTGPRSLADLANKSKTVDRKDVHEDDGVRELEKEIEKLKLQTANGVQDESDDEQPPPGFTRHDGSTIKKE
ncbi:hypothetical protein M9435_001667 [Picochlorum sp. BPE23]|nr:hypothetical protein M9435_001667 [Picochlorum sp. BPE23]